MSNENNQENEMDSVLDSLNSSANTQSEEQQKQSQMAEDGSNMQSKITEEQHPGAIQSESFEELLKNFEPHQQRVIIEANELGKKVYDLRTFISQSPIFAGLYAEEKEALKIQLFHMEQYFGVLQQRISVWEGGKWNYTKGKEVIGDFGIENEAVFILKYLASLYIDATNLLGVDPRRNSIVATDMEKTQMMAVKSVFSKRA